MLEFLSFVGFAVGVAGCCIAGLSQLQMQGEILPWARHMNGRTRVDTFVMFRPDLLTPKGQEHRKQILFGPSLFFAGILLGTVCHAFSTPPSPNSNCDL